jgi:hypothetical protein
LVIKGSECGGTLECLACESLHRVKCSGQASEIFLAPAPAAQESQNQRAFAFAFAIRLSSVLSAHRSSRMTACGRKEFFASAFEPGGNPRFAARGGKNFKLFEAPWRRVLEIPPRASQRPAGRAKRAKYSSRLPLPLRNCKISVRLPLHSPSACHLSFRRIALPA